MRNRTDTVQNRTITGAPRAAYPPQEDERLRRVRLAYADAAVTKTADLLAADLPFDQRYTVAREHETNLLRRAELRTQYGVATFTDRRVIDGIAARDARADVAVTR